MQAISQTSTQGHSSLQDRHEKHMIITVLLNLTVLYFLLHHGHLMVYDLVAETDSETSVVLLSLLRKGDFSV